MGGICGNRAFRNFKASNKMFAFTVKECNTPDFLKAFTPNISFTNDVTFLDHEFMCLYKHDAAYANIKGNFVPMLKL